MLPTHFDPAGAGGPSGPPGASDGPPPWLHTPLPTGPTQTAGPGRSYGPRVTMLLLAALLALGFGAARWLRPDPRGFGTHTQLGLPPCQFAAVTGRLCPSCGMTTAFAWFVRGRLDLVWRANPAALFLAPACLALVPWLVAGAARGRPWGFRTLETPLIGLAVAAVALSLLTWLVRLALGRAP